LPIDCGQSIDRPSAFTRLCLAAGVSAGQRVLEIGTGSGWGTAVVAAVAAKVYTVERWQTLGEQAMERFSELGCDNVVASIHDGLEGWPRHAPYDRILVDGAVDAEPTALMKQLVPGGFLVAALGRTGEPQVLTRWERGDRGFLAESLVPVRMVSLIPHRAAVL
jgi:protein-L-isoaspartate(D-aspartate) O-methyltransferase